MFGILAEDASDFETLVVIVRKLANDKSIRIKGRGCGGSGNLLNKGTALIKALQDRGCKWFIVCQDADGPTDIAPEIHEQLYSKVLNAAGIDRDCETVVPVQEIEAWLLADELAFSQVFKGWRPDPTPNPESVASPKEHIERLSRKANGRPRYAHATHNPRIAEHLRLELVEGKCPSFGRLARFVRDMTDRSNDQ